MKSTDDMILRAIGNGDIIVDIEAGKVYGCRLGRYARSDVPRELGHLDLDGYLCINLCVGSEKKNVKAHRVVYIAAYGPIPDGLVIDHINNDRTDNRIENLQLMTNSGNSKKACRERLKSALIPPEKRREIAIEYATGTETYKEIAMRYGVCADYIRDIVLNEIKCDYVFTDDGPIYAPIPKARWEKKQSNVSTGVAR